MQIPRPRISVLAALLLASLSVARTQTVPNTATDDLKGTSWQLENIQRGNDTTVTPDDKSKYTIAFDNKNGVSVRIDCNRGHGTWKSAGPGQIEFGPMALTRAMCPASPITDSFPKDWGNIRSYTFKDGHLFLSLMADGGNYEFSRLSTPVPAKH